MEEANYITVSELNFYINRIIAGEELLQNIPVLGEVSGMTMSGRNYYFTIKDEDAQIGACIFRPRANMYMPVNGEQVLLFGSPEYYSKTGKMNFIVSNIQPFGKGRIYIELEKLKKQLSQEGLFDQQFKKEIPKYPINVGVLTSRTGAVIHDIVSTIRKYNDIINITLINIPVQGDNAPLPICDALELADKQNFDVIILARGGGSFEDLLPFNNEAVARAVFATKTPIISAIGHETDFSLTDFTADVRALTPTAAAELVAFDINELKTGIINKLKTIQSDVETKLSNLELQTNAQCSTIYNICSLKLNNLTNNILTTLQIASHQTDMLLFNKENEINNNIARLSALNPASILQKGYLKALKNKKDITSVAELKQNDSIELYSHDGFAEATINTVHLKEINNGNKEN